MNLKMHRRLFMISCLHVHVSVGAGCMVMQCWCSLRVTRHSQLFRDCLQSYKMMVHVYVVPGCHSRSDSEKQLSFYILPLANHHLLKKWGSNIGRKYLPLNDITRVCTLHFESEKNKYSNKVPS